MAEIASTVMFTTDLKLEIRSHEGSVSFTSTTPDGYSFVQNLAMALIQEGFKCPVVGEKTAFSCRLFPKIKEPSYPEGKAPADGEILNLLTRLSPALQEVLGDARMRFVLSKDQRNVMSEAVGLVDGRVNQ